MEMVKRLQRRRQANMMSLLLLVVVVIMASSWMVEAATELTILQPLSVEYDKLPHCNMTTVELAAANSSVAIAPCILYDIQPTIDDKRNDTHVITVVGVFPSMCDKHRDGAVVAVEQINSGLGAKIGYYGNHHLQIRLVVAIAGNSRQLEPEAYEVAHQDLLESMLLSLNPQYILGSCSFYAALDKPLAARHQTMVLSQVGPDKFYEEDSNDYVFGVHVRSETYGLPALYALKFAIDGPSRRQQKIRIVHRDRSEFFYSTCRAVYDRAISDGFTSTTTISYNPEADHDGDGISNQEDVDFLEHIGDRACSTNEANDGIAIWACVLSDVEANTLLQKWKTNGCRLSSLWMTVASWEYPHRYPDLVPHMQSGGQWHKKMTYSDEYFPSGQHMLDYASDKFGYTLPYGALGAYHAIYLMYQNTASFVKAKDVPHIAQHYSEQYEEIRRNMLGLTVPHSLYGPTSFNAHRRNVGRGSAGMQWGVPFNTTTASGSASDYELLLVSPTDQAEATVVVPTPAASACPEGHFVNQTRLQTEASLLADKCSPCPVDTFRTALQDKCQACPNGSSTEGATGATICIRLEENMIPTRLLVFGYVIMGLVFSCAIGFGIWAILHRNDPVVQLGQLQFLLLICLGSIISSSSIIPLSVQAGALEGEDNTTAASLACQFIPWLYSTGWILEYSSLLAKSYRMYIMMQGASTMRRVTVKLMDMAKIVVVALLINWAIVIPWTIVDPLTWEREDLANNVEEGLLTQESIGKCTSDNTAAWLGSLLCFHLTVMIASNVLLWQLRTMSDRYQESKYVTLASVFASEFLILGVPILFAVGDSSTARHLALTCIIGFSDLGILLMIFVPKIKYQRKGLPEGTTVGKSIMKNTKMTQPHEVLGRSFASSFSADQMQSLRMSSLTQDYHQSVAGGSLCLQCSASLLDKSASSNANNCGGVLRFSSVASADNNKASTELQCSSAVPTASPTTSEQPPIVSDIEGDIIDGSMGPHHRTDSAGVALTKD